MSKIARCPECGGDVAFSHPASVLSVCGYCRSVIRRMDVDLEKIGSVGMVADVTSPLSIGMRGSAWGGFTVVGRIQLDHGAGTWNEWYLGLDNGKWLWLAEAQRQLYLTAPAGTAEAAPAFAKARVGHTVHMPHPPAEDGTPSADPGHVMRITEVHTATLVSAQGELPFAIDPKEEVRYADLAGPRRSFGTLDYGSPSDGGAPTAYIGKQVSYDDLQLVYPSSEERPVFPTLRAARIECPSCQGALELRAPDASLRVACPYCRSLVDVTQEPLRALTTLTEDPEFVARFPLGAEVTLRGQTYTLIGQMRRVMEQGYHWDEYILSPKEPGAFHYLIESAGHYTLVSPAHVGDLALSGLVSGRVYEGHRYRHIETYTAEVSRLRGEFPWAVEVGESAECSDYAREGFMLSVETTHVPREEINASVGEYLEPKEVHGAFGLKNAPDLRHYVAPHQPNPHRVALGRRMGWFSVTCTVIILLMIWFSARAGARRTEKRFTGTTVAGVAPSPEHIFLSEPFQLGNKGDSPAAMEVEFFASVDNGWLGADVALVSEDTGEASAFGVEVGYYHGVADGESWSEGTTRKKVTVPNVTPGNYVLRIEPAWPVGRPCEMSSDCGPSLQGWACIASTCQRSCAIDGICGARQSCEGGSCVNSPIAYTVVLRHGVAQPGWGFFFLFVLALWPFVTWLRMRHFEQRRAEDQ